MGTVLVWILYCSGEIAYFQKTPCGGEFSPVPVVKRLIFSGENPCAGDFLAPFGTKKETLIKSHLVKNFKAIF